METTIVLIPGPVGLDGFAELARSAYPMPNDVRAILRYGPTHNGFGDAIVRLMDARLTDDDGRTYRLGTNDDSAIVMIVTEPNEA